MGTVILSLIVGAVLGAALALWWLRRQTPEAPSDTPRPDAILNAATSGIIALDSAGRVVMANDQGRHILGGVNDPVPFPWPKEIRFLDPATGAPLAPATDPLAQILKGQPFHGDLHMIKRSFGHRDGRFVRLKSSRPLDGSAGIAAVVVLDDVSEYERNRQIAERQNRFDGLGQLTGGIAHDFNNVLASLLYAIDLALGENDPAQRRLFLESARKTIYNGRNLVQRLLTFGRRPTSPPQSRALSTTLREFEQLIRPILEEHVAISITQENLDLQAYCDQTQLESALMNLVLNSRDAILQGKQGGAITITVRPVSMSARMLDADPTQNNGLDTSNETGRAYRYVEIAVADNGPGMDRQTLARATDPFFTTKPVNSGSGLGLSMVYGFARQAGGDVQIYSEVGLGTTVRVTLPRGTEEGPREAPVAEVAPQLGAGETILLVEDEADLLLVLRSMLEGLGYRVVSAVSGDAAWALVASGVEFDLLFTDIVMPGKLGGFELAQKVREVHPHMPVLYSSGYTGFSGTEMGTVQAQLVQKPSPPAELAEALARAFKLGARAPRDIAEPQDP